MSLRTCLRLVSRLDTRFSSYRLRTSISCRIVVVSLAIVRGRSFLTYTIAASRAEEHPGITPGHLQKGGRHFDRSDMPSPSEMPPDDPDAREETGGPSFNTYMSWDEMGLGQDEFGFLGRFDLPDLANWFTDVPDIS